MDVLADRRSLALGDVLSLLEAEFVDDERKYQHADVDTDQEENKEEREEDASTEKNSDEDDHDLSHSELVETKASLDDQSEQAKVEQLIRESCGCQLGPHGVACSGAVSKEAIVLTRNNCLQMARKELDLVVMTQINALRTPAAHRSPSPHGQEDFRPRAQMKFFLQGVQVCQKVFLFVHAIARTRFRNLCDSVSNHGVIDRVHGNARKRPRNAFSYSSIKNASRFIVNTSDTHGLPLPGRLPTCKQKVVVLPSDMSKTKVYTNYKATCVQQQLRPMKKSAFFKLGQPAYFPTARKCQLFGVPGEPLGTQATYLIDESETVGKGANATISLLHHYLENHGIKEVNLLLHADNCIGQNKNNAFIQYLMWRVASGRHKSVQLSFMLAGHTKFAPDRHFGLIKKAYRKTRVDTIASIKCVVESSSCGANKAQLVRDNGHIQVPFYDWTNFLKDYYKSIPPITKYHVFSVKDDHPYNIILQEQSRAERESLTLVSAPSQRVSFHSKSKPSG